MDLYVSAVRGHVVGRLGSGTETVKNAQIGARFDVELQEIVWDEEEVVAIPESEHAANRRYYEKALEGGALKQRDKAAYEKWLKVAEKRGKEEAEASTKAREAELEEGKKAAEVEAKREAEFQKNRRAQLEAAKKKIDAAKAKGTKE